MPHPGSMRFAVTIINTHVGGTEPEDMCNLGRGTCVGRGGGHYEMPSDKHAESKSNLAAGKTRSEQSGLRQTAGRAATCRPVRRTRIQGGRVVRLIGWLRS